VRTLLSQIYERQDRSCLGLDPELFQPTPDDLGGAALAVWWCEQCPVLMLCRDWALTHVESGVWGGLTEQARAALLRSRRPRARCPGCKGWKITHSGVNQICLSCGVSWRAQRRAIPEQPAAAVA